MSETNSSNPSPVPETARAFPPIPPKPPCLIQRLRARGFSSVGRPTKVDLQRDQNPPDPDNKTIYEAVNYGGAAVAELIFTTSWDGPVPEPDKTLAVAVEGEVGNGNRCGSTGKVHCPPLLHNDEAGEDNEEEAIDKAPFPNPNLEHASTSIIEPQPALPNRPAVEGNNPKDEVEEYHENTVIVKNSREFVLEATAGTGQEVGMDVKAPAVKYKVHQSANGVTTISIDPNPTDPPLIHHVINLPPRKANFLKKRRRKTEDLSYQKSSRLSQLMVTEYKIWGADRPGSSASSRAPVLAVSNSKVLLENVESVGRTVKKRVGSWYRRRVKTPVDQLGLEGFKLPKVLGFGGSRETTPESNSGPMDEEDEAGGRVSYDPAGVTQQGQNEFEDLRRVVKQGGDFCKDLSAVLQERSELEAQYAKGLSKLSAKLLKASKEATGSVAHAWQAVAVQIDTQAELHRLWSSAILDEVAKPLRTSTDTQQKIRKSVEVLVEKTTRNLAEWRTAEAKAKRHCFSSSKEFEKIQESSTFSGTLASNANLLLSGHGTPNNNATTNNNTNSVLAEVRARSRLLSVPPVDKDPIKLEAKRRKAEEAVRRADIEYYTFCVRSERARLEWEGSIRNGSTCLRTLEEEKLGLLQDLAAKYFQHLNEFIPKLVRSAESLDEPIKSCSVDQDMHSIVDIRRHAGVEQLLPDFYAEDTSNLMKKDRRQEALQKFVYIIKQDLDREKKGAVGIESLAKAVAEAPKIDNAHHDISDKLYYMKSMLLYLEGSRCKLENALSDQEGRQRSHKTITQYMRYQRDKQGLPQTILKIPSWARDECLANCSGSTPTGSLSPDWNEEADRGAGDGTSNRHDTDFDEFSSEGSEHIIEEVFDRDTKGPDPDLLNAPSIGKCRVIYDYDSNMFDELTIRSGETINVHDKQEDGWWLGELNGVVGIFPATYVEEITDTTTA